MTTSRKYWVVSPNVGYSYTTVGEWRQASVKQKAAFMGWRPDDENHRLGSKFAYSIRPGDTILIARRRRGKPEIVGFGRVVGNVRKRLRGFKPPKPFGSLRQLDPFVPMSRASKRLPFSSALNQIAALHQLHPDKNPDHEILCRWMDRKLASGKTTAKQKKRLSGRTKGIHLRPLPNDKQLEYQTRTRRSASQARKSEAELVARYREWIERQDRELKIFKNHEIQCDAYEEDRKNLIEAKCAATRQYLRMAVGQLLDYSFQAKDDFAIRHKAILLPMKPHAALLKWLDSLEIGVIWEERSVFLDNANGQFT